MHWIFYTFFVEFVVEIWWSTSFEKIATVHTATSLTLNYITDIFSTNITKSSEQVSLKHLQEQIILLNHNT